MESAHRALATHLLESSSIAHVLPSLLPSSGDTQEFISHLNHCSYDAVLTTQPLRAILWRQLAVARGHMFFALTIPELVLHRSVGQIPADHPNEDQSTEPRPLDSHVNGTIPSMRLVRKGLRVESKVVTGCVGARKAVRAEVHPNRAEGLPPPVRPQWLLVICLEEGKATALRNEPVLVVEVAEPVLCGHSVISFRSPCSPLFRPSSKPSFLPHHQITGHGLHVGQLCAVDEVASGGAANLAKCQFSSLGIG